MEMPFFYVTGDHEYFDGPLAREWQKRFGPPYYHFVYKNVLFLCLNSQDGRAGTLGDEQLKYVADALRRNKDVRWTFIFMHEPIWLKDIYRQETGWDELEAMIKDKPHTIFAGHFHRYIKFERNYQRYFILATTGGWQAGLGEAFGEFDEIAWVSVTDHGPRFANLTLKGIFDENAFTEKQARLLPGLKPVCRRT